MNKTSVFLLLLLVAAGAGMLGAVIGSRTDAPKHLWEYDVSRESADLRGRGRAGWELLFVNVIPGQTNGAEPGVVYTFRRPLKDK